MSEYMLEAVQKNQTSSNNSVKSKLIANINDTSYI